MNSVNNQIYNELGSRWYLADDDPVALLRAESKLRNPWICEQIGKKFGLSEFKPKVLDIGCGAGFLSNTLAQQGYEVTGVDLSESSLAVAKQYDRTQSVNYVYANADALPLAGKSQDVVCAMDFLEHVENPSQIIAEAARVLKPGGLFFFYTFNRNPLSWLLIIKAVEWFVHNTPANLHLYRYFIKPREMKAMCREAGLIVNNTVGIKPVILTPAVWKLITTGKVSPEFRFEFTRSEICGYLCSGEKT